MLRKLSTPGLFLMHPKWFDEPPNWKFYHLPLLPLAIQGPLVNSVDLPG